MPELSTSPHPSAARRSRGRGSDLYSEVGSRGSGGASAIDDTTSLAFLRRMLPAVSAVERARDSLLARDPSGSSLVQRAIAVMKVGFFYLPVTFFTRILLTI